MVRFEFLHFLEFLSTNKLFEASSNHLLQKPRALWNTAGHWDHWREAEWAEGQSSLCPCQPGKHLCLSVFYFGALYMISLKKAVQLLKDIGKHGSSTTSSFCQENWNTEGKFHMISERLRKPKTQAPKHQAVLSHLTHKSLSFSFLL